MSGQDKESARQRNRAAHPLTAALLDDFRRHFGDCVALVYSDMDGLPVGRKQPAPLRFVTAGQWLETSARIERARKMDEVLRRKR